MCQGARIQDLYLNKSEMKLSVTTLFSVQIMSYLEASGMIYSDISDILKYESSVIQSLTEKPSAVQFTPKIIQKTKECFMVLKKKGVQRSRIFLDMTWNAILF